MEKKLKVNFILKGIAVFAFVAFCLLAILAGVTLPFVSNASTTDSAVLNAESDCAVASAESNTFNPLDFCIPLSQCNTTDTYYGFFVTQNCYNLISNHVFGSFNIELICEYSFLGSDVYCVGTLIYDTELNNKAFRGSFGDNIIFDLGSSLTSYQFNNLYYLNVTGLKFSSISDNSFNSSLYVFNQLPFGGDTSELENQIAILTAEKNALQAQLTEKQILIDTLTAEKTALQTQVNNLTSDKAALQAHLTEKQNQIDTLTAEKTALQTQLTEKQNQIDTLIAEKNALQSQLDNISFSSRFGFVSNFSSSFLYANLNVFPVIPDNLTTIKDTSGNYINGWYQSGNSFYLSIVTAYISPTDVRLPSICGWSLVPRSDDNNYDLYFSFLGSAVYFCGVAQIVDNSVKIIDSTFKQVLVDSNVNGNVYMVSSSLYNFKLNSIFNKDDVKSFFALVDFDNFSPTENQYYFAGFNAASKGYYDDGYDQGYSVGKEEGYNTGFTAGDSNGFARGLDSANNYSFLSLFGAIFDAPINALFGGTTTLPAGTIITDKNGNTTTLSSSATVHRAGLLNFEVMGVNLSGFVLAMFSLSIIIVVLKFALAKK